MKIRQWVFLTAAFLVGIPSFVSAQAKSDQREIGNREIQWVFPGNFDDAEKRADEEGRILIIKGLGFGLDETGATCATKGDW